MQAGIAAGESDDKVGPGPGRMVLAAFLIVLAALGLFLASTAQAVHLIDQRTVDIQVKLVSSLLADYPTSSEVSPTARALHIAKLADLHSPHVGVAPASGSDEAAQPLAAANGSPAPLYLIWTPRRAASEVFAEVAPYRLIIVGMLIPILLAVLLRFRSFAIELDTQRRTARRLAARDSLTGLANRLVFDNRLTAELATPVAEGETLALMLLDLNDFKQVNDTLGHTAGDEVLIEMAARLRSMVAPPALAARLGGDEFAVVMRVKTGTKALLELALDLHTALAEPYRIRGQTVEAPASIGIAMAPEHGDSEDELLRAADAALYAAKDRRDLPYLVARLEPAAPPLAA